MKSFEVAGGGPGAVVSDIAADYVERGGQMTQVVDALVVGAGPGDGRDEELLLRARLGKHVAGRADRAAEPDEPQPADRADAVHVEVRKPVLERAGAGRELVVGAERLHVRGGGDEQLRARTGELPRRFGELDVEADERRDG